MRSAETSGGIIGASSSGASANIGYGPRATASTSFSARRGGIFHHSSVVIFKKKEKKE